MIYCRDCGVVRPHRQDLYSRDFEPVAYKKLLSVRHEPFSPLLVPAAVFFGGGQGPATLMPEGDFLFLFYLFVF